MEYILIGASGICGITDILYRKIPNYITFPLLFIAFGINIYKGNFIMALIGFSLAFIIGFVGFVLGQMGAGDIKLMSALGAGFGLEPLFSILLVASIVGLIYALVAYIIKTINEGKISDKISALKVYAFNHKVFGASMLKDFLKRENKHPIPFGTCLFIGVIIVKYFF